MRKVIAIDFDGTCVMHEYPKVGKEVPGVRYALELLQKNNVSIILWTMRSGKHLQAAVDWFLERGIRLFGINENPEQKSWTQSPKAYAQIYIDDAAIGCPLLYSKNGSRPFVNWNDVLNHLYLEGFINSDLLEYTEEEKAFIKSTLRLN